MEEKERRKREKNRGKKILILGIAGVILGLTLIGKKSVMGAILFVAALVVTVIGGAIVNANTHHTDLM